MSSPGTSGGTLPQSNALAEASPESLGDLFSRDPETYTEGDLVRIVGAMRAQRERLAAAAGAKASAPKGERLTASAATKLVAGKSAEDLDL